MNGPFGNMGTPWLNDAGDFVFGAFENDDPYRRVWIRSRAGNLELVAAEYDPVPGLVDTHYLWNIDEVRIANSGVVLLSTRLDQPPPADGSGLFAIDDASHEIVAMGGEASPAPGGTPFLYVSADLDFDDSGHAAFRADIGAGAPAIFTWIDGLLSIVVVDGDPGPASTGGTLALSSVQAPSINSAGEVAFDATLVESGPVGTSYRFAAFVHDGESLDAIAIEGDAVPGHGARVFYEILEPHINDRGEVFFVATTRLDDGPPLPGLFVARDGRIETVLFVGDVLPESGGSAISWVQFRSVATNDLGQVAVQVTFEDTREAIYLLTPTPGQVPVLTPIGLGSLIGCVLGAGVVSSRKRSAPPVDPS